MRSPPLAEFVLLSMLLHALAIALFGAPSGGSREGRAMWSPLHVTLLAAPREEAPRLKVERSIAAPPAPKPRPAHRRVPRPPIEPMQPMHPIEPMPPMARAAPFVPPLLDRIAIPERKTDPPAPQVPPPTENRTPAPTEIPSPPPKIEPAPPIESPTPATEPTPPVEAPPIEAKPLPVPEVPPTPPVEAAPIEAKPLPVPEVPPTPPVEAAPIEAKPLPVPEESTKTPEPVKPAEGAPMPVPALAAPEAARVAPSQPAPQPQVAAPTPSPPAPSESPPPGESLFRPAAPATGYDPTAPSGPALDLDAIRRRAGEIAREGSGQRALLPFPMPPVPPKKSAMEKAIGNARKPDCRTAYQSMGLAAVVPLVANEFGEGNCRW